MAMRHQMRLGTYLVQEGLLSKKQAQDVLETQHKQWLRDPEHFKPRFGRVAVRKGYIDPRQLERAFLDKSRQEILG